MKTIEERAKLKAKMYLSDCIDENVRTTLTDDFIAGYIQGSKEQKAIDEEVRLKKCDDMTEAEYNRETHLPIGISKKERGHQHTLMPLSGRGKICLIRPLSTQMQNTTLTTAGM